MESSTEFGWLFVALGAIGFAMTVYIWSQLVGIVGGEFYKVVGIKNFSFDMFSHIVSYLPSLLAFGLGSEGQINSLILFYIFYIFMLGFSDVVVLNPILHVFGWRYKSAVLEHEDGTEEVVVLSPPHAQLVLGNLVLNRLANFGIYLLDAEQK